MKLAEYQSLSVHKLFKYTILQLSRSWLLLMVIFFLVSLEEWIRTTAVLQINYYNHSEMNAFRII